MQDTIQSLKSRIGTLEVELNAMHRMHGASMEKKDPKAWDRLHAIGKEITKKWKIKKPSWQLISDDRR
jgi:hypothetical protein